MKVMCSALTIALFALIFTGHMNTVSGLSMAGLLAIGQIIFACRF